ncbi:hypothetical protein CSUI_009953 [Cystoisospora suis]|uniref:Uncharacterized protein n=1 Tax=Cystoisospora suis TaxID=483139 RepID=A0A2C6KIK6_9APIC|nr:hypothetical protein CSUI_009953 [Cystoisospora suis]
MDVEKQQRLLDEIERRLMLCEEAIGMDPARQKAMASLGMNTPASTADFHSSLVMNICRLHHQTTQLFRGNLLEMEERYQQMKVWLENEQVAAAKLILTLEAKRTYVLQHEEMLRNAAAQLRQLHELEQFVNPPQLAEMESFKKRMEDIDARGNALTERAVRLEGRVMNIAQVYNTTMNMLASVFEEWHEQLTEEEANPTKTI